MQLALQQERRGPDSLLCVFYGALVFGTCLAFWALGLGIRASWWVCAASFHITVAGSNLLSTVMDRLAHAAATGYTYVAYSCTRTSRAVRFAPPPPPPPKSTDWYQNPSMST